MSTTEYDREVCIMQDAETVLNVIRERGERGLPLENIYRLLYNRNLYLRAYGRIYSNQGATTKGITAETMDGMSLAKIDRIIEALRYERFRWTPVRRVTIPISQSTQKTELLLGGRPEEFRVGNEAEASSQLVWDVKGRPSSSW